MLAFHARAPHQNQANAEAWPSAKSEGGKAFWFVFGGALP